MSGNIDVDLKAVHPRIHLTTDVDEFLGVLKPADVLLFDSARPLSGLIKFGENRPVNHSALLLEHHQLAESTQHGGGAGVRQIHAREHLESPLHRTVTALRHESARTEDLSPVLECADRYLGARTPYGFRSLYRLIVPSLYRSYLPHLESGTGTRNSNRRNERLLSIIGALVDSSLSYWNSPDPETGRRDDPDVNGLTCSEFVYRCFAEAAPTSHPLCLEVIEPLIRIKGGREPAFRSNRPAFRSATIDEEDDLLFHESISTQSQTGSVSFRGSGGPTKPQRELALVAKDILRGAVKRRLLPARSDIHHPQGDAIVPDTITPRDLWSSPSLRPCAVLHRPPCPEDARFDDEIAP